MLDWQIPRHAQQENTVESVLCTFCHSSILIDAVDAGFTGKDLVMLKKKILGHLYCVYFLSVSLFKTYCCGRCWTYQQRPCHAQEETPGPSVLCVLSVTLQNLLVQ